MTNKNRPNYFQRTRMMSRDFGDHRTFSRSGEFTNFTLIYVHKIQKKNMSKRVLIVFLVMFNFSYVNKYYFDNLNLLYLINKIIAVISGCILNIKRGSERSFQNFLEHDTYLLVLLDLL